jgi:hypothetical protein
MDFSRFSEIAGKHFIAVGEYFEGDPVDTSILDILAIDREGLKPFTRQLLNGGDESLPEERDEWLAKLRWEIRAYLQFQDILDVPVEGDIVNRHYCFYESLVYLRESVMSWLDGNVLAALTLLRPFMELSLLHLYWHLHYKDRGSSKPYYNWLMGEGGKPGFRNAVDYIFKKLTARGYVEERRLDELKRVILNAYKTLCSYNHTPKMEESLTTLGGGFGSIAYESFAYYLITVNLVLRQIVYSFILVYPMVLFPVDGYRKWGFNGPVGLFFDKCNYAILETCLGKKNISGLKQSLRSVPEVDSLLTWFEGLSDAEQAELEAGWQRFRQSSKTETECNEIPMRLALFKAFHRAAAWALNYVPDRLPGYKGIPDEVAERIVDRVEDW